MSKLKQIAVGAAYCIPGASRLSRREGNTASARYCYSAWMRHLSMAKLHGMNSNPSAVAELGPGGSVGLGLAALLSGAETYNAFDVISYASLETNQKVFDELVELFRSRAAIPGPDEFPRVKPPIASYDFPADILTEARLADSLNEDRLSGIRQSLLNTSNPASQITYMAPWFDARVIRDASVDMIFSQAVLEHVDELESTYQCMYQWLKPGGCISHQIDFKCHGTADVWNGHWAYSDRMWRLIRGGRPYLINRQPASEHIRLIEQAGFRILHIVPHKSETSLSQSQLAPRFQNLSDDDLTTSGAYVLAVKE